MAGLICAIDESGNSGEVIVKNRTLDELRNQPYFSLGCIGIPNNQLRILSNHIESLKNKYNIHLAELKTQKIYKKKPMFIYDLLKYLYNNKYPLFIELMDKKFYLATQITSSCFFPPTSGVLLNEIGVFACQGCAEYLYFELPDSIFSLFCKACRDPSHENYYSVFIDLEDFLKRQHDEIAASILMHLISSKEDYENSKNRDAFKRFLPLPDMSKRNEIISLLHHVNAFANICARIQKYCVDFNIGEIKIKHDEQNYFDEIIMDNFRKMIELPTSFKLPTYIEQRADFKMPCKMTLTFARSRDCLELQIADIVAGTVNRIWRDFKDRNLKDDIYRDVMNSILFRYPEMHSSIGVNCVTSKIELEQLQKLVS